jgi:hypothetical protein
MNEETLNTDTMDVTNSKLDILEASLTAMEAKMDVDNVVYDNQLTKLTEIDTAIDTIDSVLDASLVKQTAILGELESILSSSQIVSEGFTSCDTDTLEASLTSMEGKLDTIDTVLDASLVKQTNVEALITTLDGVQDNIFSQIYSQEQEVIALKQANHTDLVALEASLTSMEAKMDTDNAVYDNQLTKLTEIDTAIDTIDTVLDASLVKQTSIDVHQAANRITLSSILAKNTEIETSVDALISANHTDLVALEASLTSMESKMDVDNAVYDNQLTKLTNNETLLTAIDEDTNAIKLSAAALVVDAAATEVLITATNSLLTDLDTVQDNALTKLGEIETTANAIQSAVEGTLTVGSHAVTNAGTFAVQSAATLQAGSAAIGKLAANSGVDIGDVDVTSISAGTNRIGMVGLKANEAADGSSTERHLLCDSAGHLQVDVLSAPVTLADSATATNTAACATDLAAIEVLQTAANVDLAAIEVLLTAANVDHAANEVLLGTIDADTNAIKDSTAACATDLAALEVLSTAANVDLAALEVLSTAANVLHSALVSKATLSTTSEVKEFLDNTTINAGAQSAQFDTENYERVRFFGESTSSVGTDIVLMGSNADGGTFYILGENLRSDTIGSTHYVYGQAMENLPRYIKLLNKSGSTNYIFPKLYFQGSGGRVAV